jgi:hypothetical protein
MFLALLQADKSSWQPIGLAVLGIVASAAATYYFTVRSEKRKVPALFADFIDTIKNDLAAMIDMFNKRQVPRQAGHSLDAKVSLFTRSINQELLSAPAREALKQLTSLNGQADTVDLYLDQGNAGDEARKAWIEQAERVMGALQGEAARLRAGIAK